jgi:hypothetical protein
MACNDNSTFFTTEKSTTAFVWCSGLESRVMGSNQALDSKRWCSLLLDVSPTVEGSSVWIFSGNDQIFAF